MAVNAERGQRFIKKETIRACFRLGRGRGPAKGDCLDGTAEGDHFRVGSARPAVIKGDPTCQDVGGESGAANAGPFGLRKTAEGGAEPLHGVSVGSNGPATGRLAFHASAGADPVWGGVGHRCAGPLDRRGDPFLFINLQGVGTRNGEDSRA